jgi:hypothetical protein
VSIFSPSSDAVDALQYFLLIRNDEPSEIGPKGSKRDQCIKDLLLDTREFDAILKALGDAKHIITLAAISSEENGKYDDAIRLYERAKVIFVI